MKLISNVKGDWPKTSREGVYDSTILCDDCEKKFSDPDSYAAELLLQSPLFRWGDGVNVWYYTLPSYQYARLKLFFISLLWRAAVSTADMFNKVNLMKETEEKLRTMLIAGKAGHADDFAINLTVYDDEPAAAMTMSPVRRELEGIACYKFKLHRYSIHIKVAEGPHSPTVRAFQLSAFPPCIILASRWRESADFRAAKRMVEELHERGVRVFPRQARQG